MVLLLIALQLAAPSSQTQTQGNLIDSSLPGDVTYDDQPIIKSETNSCRTVLTLSNGTIDIDWHATRPEFRPNDSKRYTLLAGHRLLTTDQHVADRVEAAFDRLSAACATTP